MTPVAITRLARLTRCFRSIAISPLPHRPRGWSTATTCSGYHTTPVAPAGFTYLPDFLSKKEQLCLTKAALAHLDNVGPTAARRRQKRMIASLSISTDEYGFLSDESCYEFEHGHFDGVIRHYREARITDAQWAAIDNEGALITILGRVKSLLPPVETQCHILHLSSDGEILPHVDNVDASGSIILGVSLGSSRVLRLESVDKQLTDDGSPACYELLLEPGSCYIQRLATFLSGDFDFTKE
ncbi:hypothetical protein FRC17_005970 [Serendipita sp. 399]|nr:hypothetical protein FRC17_005970 [Serendipita sp. 399]